MTSSTCTTALCLPLRCYPPSSRDFSEEETLTEGKPGKSAGGHTISLELLRALVDIPDGHLQLLQWFNSLLHSHSGSIPEEWLPVVMVLLPESSHPSLPNDARPISIGSAVERVLAGWCWRDARVVWGSPDDQILAMRWSAPAYGGLLARSLQIMRSRPPLHPASSRK